MASTNRIYTVQGTFKSVPVHVDMNSYAVHVYIQFLTRTHTYTPREDRLREALKEAHRMQMESLNEAHNKDKSAMRGEHTRELQAKDEEHARLVQRREEEHAMLLQAKGEEYAQQLAEVPSSSGSGLR